MNKDIDSTIKLDDLKLFQILKQRESKFISMIDGVNSTIKALLESGIPVVFPNYTLHNIEHSYRVIKYMGDIVKDTEKLNELEITIMILVGLLHDVGMAVSTKDIELIKSDNFPHFEIKYSAVKKYVGDNNDDLALQEYIRMFHSGMSGLYIQKELSGKFKISENSSLSFEEDVIKICQSHTESFDWIKQNLKDYTVKGDFHFNSQFISHLLRLGDILDIDEKRTPLSLYNLLSLKGRSNDEWLQHFVIQNYEKIEINNKSKLKQITFRGNCKDAHIHRKLLTYFDWVNDELINAIASTSNMPEQYRLDFENTIIQDITTEGYTFSDYKMKLDFEAISSLLMGEKIYGLKELGLRELIQNSIDACKYRKELEYSGKKYGEVDYIPRIKVIIDKENNSVSIKDNGIGMSIDILKNHFLNIGKSYYKSSSFLLQDISYKPIGNYGIGFLACFMLSNNIKVITRYFNQPDKYIIEIEKGNEYTSMLKSEDVEFEGTEVVFNFTEFISVFNNEIKNVSNFLTKFFITDEIELELIDVVSKTTNKIINLINTDIKPEKGIAINLNDYLNDIEGYAVVKLKDNFIRGFQDVSFKGNLYLYDHDNGLTRVEDFSTINITDYLVDNKLKYYELPIIESKNELDYLNGLKFTDNDASEVVNKMSNELTWLSILPQRDNYRIFEEEELELGDYIFDNYKFENLAQFGHILSCKTVMFERTLSIFEGLNNIFLPFKQIESRFYWLSPLYNHKIRQEMFVRNVLIKDYNFNISILASIFDINEILVNIKSKKIIPDISRNKLSFEHEKTLNYSIGKAIHKGIVTSEKLNFEEKQTLKLFIDSFYSEISEFEITSTT